MNRLVIVIVTAIVIVIAGLIIFIKPWDGDVEVVDDDDDDVVLPPPPPVGPDADDDDDDVVLPPPRPPIPGTVSVSINAIPWARVFIKLPKNDYFMEPRAGDFTIPPKPNQKDSNVTPIPGNLKVPVGTAIKLMYRDREKIFLYDQWKDGKTISYDFLNP